MTTDEIKKLTDAELRRKYFAKKAKVLKRFGANCGGKKIIVWKMLPGRVATTLGMLCEEYYRRFPFRPQRCTTRISLKSRL